MAQGASRNERFTRFCAREALWRRIVAASAKLVATASILTTSLIGGASATQPSALTAASNVMVLYSDVGTNYQRAFDEIMAGIDDRAKISLRKVPIGQNVDADETAAIVRKANPKVVIALGRHAATSAMGLDKDVSVVVGAVLTIPPSGRRTVAGISLAADPAILFAKLKSLHPSVRRVSVVFNPDQNDWLIRIAKDAARSLGLELVTYPARDLSMAVKAYESAFSVASAKTDALWIPQDYITGEEGTILPMALKESWSRNIAVFSSNFSHLARGALFAPYPINARLGYNLAEIAINLQGQESGRQSISLMREMNIYVNPRTAEHLGLNLDALQRTELIMRGTLH